MVAASVGLQSSQEVICGALVFFAFRPVEVCLGLDHNHSLVKRANIGLFFIHLETGLLRSLSHRQMELRVALEGLL